MEMVFLFMKIEICNIMELVYDENKNLIFNVTFSFNHFINFISNQYLILINHNF